MADTPRSRSARQKVRVWCHEVFDSMAELDGAGMFDFAEQALRDAGSDAVRQTLVELSAGSGTPGVTAALIRAAVRTGSTQLARAAADLLIDIKDPESAKSIIKECLESEDSAVRVRAVEALEALEDPEVFGLMRKALLSGDDNVSRAAVNSFGLILGGKYHPLKSHLLDSLADTESELFTMVSQTDDIALKREFAKILGFADSDAVLPLLEKLAEDPDTQTRREAVLALAANRSAASMKIAERKLDDEDEMIVTFALDALASRVGRDSEHMLECIRKVIKHPNEAVRRNAVMMLNWFPHSRIEDVLRGAAKDPDFEVQRSAQSLLRTMKIEPDPVELTESEFGRGEENTLRIWEAGNVGMESRQSESKIAVDSDTVYTDAIVAELERQAGSGDIARRSHIITELVEMEDISDSPMLLRALYDDSESIRARAARGLDFTRDAGLATRVLFDHPDSLVRRRAVDALAENPSERTRGSRGRSKGVTTFASERTQGMELFSYFLKALDDPDEGVRQSACYAIGHYPEFNCPIPVRETMEKLKAMESDRNLSSLTRDNAAELIDDISEAKIGEPLLNAVNAALAGLESVKEASSRLSEDKESGEFSLSGIKGDAAQAGAELAGEWGIEPERAFELAQAAAQGSPLSEQQAAIYADSVAESASLIFDAVGVGARALSKLGEDGWSEQLKTWLEELESFSADMPDAEMSFSKREHEANRALIGAIISIRMALQAPEGGPQPDTLEDFTGSEDGWVRLKALLALKDAGMGAADMLRSLVESYSENPEFDRVTGAAAIELVREGDEKGLEALAGVLERCSLDQMADLMHAFIAAAQEGEVSEMIKETVERGSCAPLASICMKMAAVAGGVDDVDIGCEPEEAEIKCRYAYRALRAMKNEKEAAEELKNALRSGEPEERKPAAVFLGLSRVESAVSVYAGVSDQVDAPWSLRTLCGGLMVRSGHRQGMGWFNKSMGHGNAVGRALVALDLGRAIVDVIPLMLGCNEVNVGRFV